jgi:uncharacterized membrane protein YidH (DUF202 family)
MISIVTTVLGVVIFIIAMSLIPAIFKFKRDEKTFIENHTVCDAEIVGYRLRGSKRRTLLVMIRKDGKDIICQCNSSAVSYSSHPKGTIVKVAFFAKRTFGIESFDVRMIEVDNRPYSKSHAQVMLIILIAFLCCISVATIITGRNIA